MNSRPFAALLALLPVLLMAQAAPRNDDRAATDSAESPKPVADEKSAKNSEKKNSDGTLMLEAYQVTGSRIPKLAGQASTTPVFSFTAEDIKLYGASTLSDFRRMITQLGATSAGNDWTTFIGSGPSTALENRTSFSLGGLNFLGNNLGGVTLVLVDGRRLAKSGQSFSGQGNLEDYDLNGIPLEAIERIDVLSGGASSIYGADAMAGVINVILKKNASYDNTTVNLRYDNTFRSDAAIMSGSVTQQLRRGKFQFSASVNYESGNALANRDRWYLATDDLMGAFGGEYDNRSSYVGAVWATSGNLPGLSVERAAIPAGSKGDSSVGSFGSAGAPLIYDGAKNRLYRNPYRARGVTTSLGYDFAPAFNVYGDFRLNERISSWQLIPSLGGYYPAYDYSFGFMVPAGKGGNPFGTAVMLNKQFTDLARQNKSTSRNPAATLGARGDFEAWTKWHYDTYLAWTRSEQISDAVNNFDLTKLANAYVTGNGPILLYDSAAGNPNPAGVLESYLNPAGNSERSDSTTYNFTLRGSVWQLPAGELQLVVGGEWLLNRSFFWSDPKSSFADYMLKGTVSRSDTALFTEMEVPLLSEKQNVPLVHALNVNLSARRDDYSDIGSATTPRVAVLLQPFSWLTLRASRSEGFMPPSLWNLNAPYYEFPYPLTVGQGTYYPLRDPLRNNEYLTGTINTFIVGHHDLRPMTSVSKNLGAVIDVRFVKGLSLGFDVTLTDVEDSIGGAEYQELINNFPTRVVRAPSTGGLPGKITKLDTSSVNSAGARSQSATVSLGYTNRNRWGDFSLQASYTVPWVSESRYSETSGVTVAELPKRVSGAVSWRRGPLSASVSAIYQSAFNYQPDALLFGVDYGYSGYIEWTPRLAYNFARDGREHRRSAGALNRLLADLEFSVSVPNVFDREPTLAQAGGQRFTGDPRGRRYVLDLTKKF